jgi:hypothetical protein
VRAGPLRCFFGRGSGLRYVYEAKRYTSKAAVFTALVMILAVEAALLIRVQRCCLTRMTGCVRTLE